MVDLLEQALVAEAAEPTKDSASGREVGRQKPPCAPRLLCVGRYKSKRPAQADGKKLAPISPLALEIVQRMDRLFEVERSINGQSSPERLTIRRELSAPLVDELEALMLQHRPGLSRHDDLAKAMDYMLKRWPAFTQFLQDGRLCLTKNSAEWALRGLALGRKAWLFAGSDRGGQRTAFMYSLIVTTKLSDIDPLAWLAYVLARIADHPSHQLDALLPMI